MDRYSGPFPHPNILAFYVVLVLGVLLYLWKSKRSTANWAVKGGIMLYMLVLLVILFATKTRSAWISAGLLFLVYSLLIERRFLLLLLLVPLVAMLVPDVRDRVFDLQQGNELGNYARLNSFAWRKLIWSDALSWMRPSHYALGYGAGAFVYNSPVFFTMYSGAAMGAHNVLMQEFFDMGIAGLLTYLLMLKRGLSLVLRVQTQDRLVATIFGSLVVSYVLLSLSDNMLDYLVFNWYFWFAVGAVCSVVTQSMAKPLPATLPEHLPTPAPSHLRGAF